jgi:hypothetical protein
MLVADSLSFLLRVQFKTVIIRVVICVVVGLINDVDFWYLRFGRKTHLILPRGAVSLAMLSQSWDSHANKKTDISTETVGGRGVID